MKECLQFDILCSPLCPAESVKNFAVWYNLDFSLFKSVRNVFESCVMQLRGFRWVRYFLTHDSSILMANAVVSRQCIQDSVTGIVPKVKVGILHPVQQPANKH